MSGDERPPLDPTGAESELDPYRRWDAAYVLGALSPAERREFEDHLSTCDDCRSEIAGIAGLPGLLAQMSPEDAAVLADGGELPPGRSTPDLTTPAGADVLDLAPTTPISPVARVGTAPPEPASRPVPRQRRRLTAAVVALAAALALLVGVVGVAVFRGSFDLERPSAAGPFRLAFSPVVPSGITAVVDVVPESEGTELKVECQYASEGQYAGATGQEYSIVVVDRTGHATEVKTWRARTDHQMTPTGRSELPVSRIARVEIRPAHSEDAILRADLP